MSTLRDLFNIKIGLTKKAVFVEKLNNSFLVLKTEERTPVREKVHINRYYTDSFEEIFNEEGITRENIYYIISPHHYYRNTLRFPFSEQQKIESVIKYEVRDYLPSEEIEYLTDFYLFEETQSKNNVLTFTIEKEEIGQILQSLGQYRENLKAIIPFDIAVYQSIVTLLDMDTFLFMDLQDDAVYLQYINNGVLKNIVFIRYEDNKRYKESLRAELLMLLKAGSNPVIYTNTRRTVKEEFEKLTLGVLDETQSTYRKITWSKGESIFINREDIDFSDLIAFLGVLRNVNQTKVKKVNLLTEEFKPKLRGYVSIKEFTILGSVLILLLMISTVNLFFDIKFKKDRVLSLTKRMNDMSMEYFEKPLVNVEETKQLLSDVQGKIEKIHTATDREFSSTQLLKEFSASLPIDVDVEYTDIIVERDHIKFYGQTKTFSDIDRIKESLALSEYFSRIEVSNTGTTGSTEGFSVTFVFDIDVVEE
ncbi:MAG: hypothetical protein JSV25_08605 [Spirochaetota bacterium]|nr:MAG: hypothetical protein JSV25_08605 [Spirochaetota bacterium]